MTDWIKDPEVCWPQFGTFGDLPKHGFARNSGDWKLAAKSIDAETGNPEVTRLRVV